MRSSGLGKPFHHRLHQRVRTWNLRREKREPFEFQHLGRIMAKRRRRKPPAIKRALKRARHMLWWERLFDPDLPF